MKERKILCSFPHCNLHAIVLSVVGQSHLVHMFTVEHGVNQAWIQLSKHKRNIGNCCFVSVFRTVFQITKKEEIIYFYIPHDVNSPNCVAWQMLVPSFYIIGNYLKPLIAVALGIKKKKTKQTTIDMSCIGNVS